MATNNKSQREINSYICLPLYIVLHGICVTFTFHILSNELPLVTKVSLTGFVVPIPASIYTEKSGFFNETVYNPLNSLSLLE